MKDESESVWKEVDKYRGNYIKEMRKTVGHAPLMTVGCGAIIENDKGQILLQKRRDNGKWAILGGCMEIGENVRDVVKREVFEEAGIEVDELELFGIYSGEESIIVYPNKDICNVTGIVFRTSSYKGEIKNNTEEAIEHRFFHKTELPDDLNEYDARIIMDWVNCPPKVNTIFKRRSIRNYTDQEVEKEKLILLLKAAMAAPTAANRQPWEFIVVNDKERLNELRGTLRAGQYNAPVAIVVCGNMKLAFSNQDKEIWTQDCSAAIENMLIAAVELGLGSVWIGLYPTPSKCAPVSKVLNIPEHVIPMSVVYFGYPGEFKEPRTQYNEERIYWQEYEPKRKHRARPKNIKKLGPL